MAKWQFEDVYFSFEDRYWIGRELTTGRYCVWFPVTASAVEHNEQYELSPKQFDAFLADHDEALEFVEECRRREHDDLLFSQPGWNRGIPVR